MTIQILSPQLANQIAAGEVVERPASVIKELVENSLDAGATRVDIEIDKGGSKLIKIQDNGSGIPKLELSLALSRHATSKLSTLDDLDTILSFGFRGEALASISSVSRLTLTSRTSDQTEAWQAYTEGSDMAVKIIPAAHPVGTSIEAVDLFFNTPARRRFLKSDKTEFTHIDEWLKRIALVKPEIHFTLKHNGKQVRNYRPANNQDQYLMRLAQVSGKIFAEQAIEINSQHEGLKLSGFIQSPYFDSPSSDTQFFYVNGRLIRDRLVNHAVKQAFAEYGTGEQTSYVLMLEIEPNQVDVNVHPAKHEVRFHQSRYVHDYILQALQSALIQVTRSSMQFPEKNQGKSVQEDWSQNKPLSESRVAEVNPSSYLTNLGGGSRGTQSVSLGQSNLVSSYNRGNGASRSQAELPSASEIAAYTRLLKTPEVDRAHSQPNSDSTSLMPPVLAGEYWVHVVDDKLSLLSIEAIANWLVKKDIMGKITSGLVSQPLLMPVSIKFDEDWLNTIDERELLLRKLGIEITIRLGQLIIKKVPPYLRQSQLVTVIPELLQWLRFEEPSHEALASWLVTQDKARFESVVETWRAFSMLDKDIQHELTQKAKVLPWQSWLEEQPSD
ncbi:DNA mismatch repair endonuclease MutL [Shewanella sp. D64]|uniref:DNA mismatch repair endonuclease MutL n=1 Tax=unclassified Shewanella TaxID=196818 RepID=UPI0022BA13B4|nr:MULTISPECIES: DNA mismatch repair endonuclease MutL [unclassified Shewanella]MEC4724662.1 DNA mismatch repair endonuclease MutL [Shewanella sp. D64]MEC4736561.1 DNA mismatch repair endonuclease MutL [Shewanella sp. E94]WBJ94762.1 DNA mismatch repair endonuclease MutL [Shewanella sp. MTB7]